MPFLSRLPLGPLLLTLSLGVAFPALAQDKAGLSPLDPKTDEAVKAADAMAAASAAEIDRQMTALTDFARDRAQLIDQVLAGYPDLRDRLLAEAKVLEGIKEGEARNAYADKLIEAYLSDVNAFLEGVIKLLDFRADIEALYHLLFDPVCTPIGSGGMETCTENPAAIALIELLLTQFSTVIYLPAPEPTSPPPPATLGLVANEAVNSQASNCSDRDSPTVIDAGGLRAFAFTGPNGECQSHASSVFSWRVERGGTLSGEVAAEVVADSNTWAVFGAARSDCHGRFSLALNGEGIMADGRRGNYGYVFQWAGTMSFLFGSNGTGPRDRTARFPISLQVQPGDVFSVEFKASSSVWVDGAGEASCVVRMSGLEAAIGILP